MRSYHGNIVNYSGGQSFFSLTGYFRLDGYQNSHRYTCIRFRIQTKEQTLAMSKMGRMVAKNKVLESYGQIHTYFGLKIDLIKYIHDTIFDFGHSWEVKGQS